MNLSDIIESYIKSLISDEDIVEVKRSDLASHFSCVPSQINYVISTRFSPEHGFYVESRRGGGGYIKIRKVNLDAGEYITHIIENMGHKLSQNVLDVYMQNLLSYNIIDIKTYNLIHAALSDKSLVYIDIENKDRVRAQIFKSILINLI